MSLVIDENRYTALQLFEDCTHKNSAKTFYYSLARYALLDALSLHSDKSKRSILVPNFICRDILAPINIAQIDVLWYDVGENLKPVLHPSKWPEADFVIAVNYFGFPQDLSPFSQYSRQTGACIIEDNSHGFLSRSSDGEWLGTRSDLGLFSIRKTLRLPDGAALQVSKKFSKNIGFESNPEAHVGFQPNQFFKSKIRNTPILGESVYRSLLTSVRLFRRCVRGSELVDNEEASENIIPYMPNPWSGLKNSLAKTKVFHETKRRREAYKYFENACNNIGLKPVFENLPHLCCPYGFPLRGTGKQVQFFGDLAREKGYDFVPWPDLPDATKRSVPPFHKNVHLVIFQW